MFWFRTGVLSDRMIEKYLGKKVYIWPFEKANLKGSTYNLTASCVAISASTKKSLLNENYKISIPSNDTALIQTNESIYVTEDICGTYHSKVSLVTKGLSHIGTTLDPCYFGTSLIAIHNHSNEPVDIKVGNTFASLMFHKIPKSSRSRHDNPPFRNDLVSTHSFDFKDDAKIKEKDYTKKIEDWYNEPWRKNKEDLIEQVENYVLKRDRRKKDKTIDSIFHLTYGVIAISLLINAYRIFNSEEVPDYIGFYTFGAFLLTPILQGIFRFMKEHKKGE